MSTAPKPKKVTKAKPKSRATQQIDLDKHCGVPLDTGGLCGRSLTCKTHAMGAKRAVKGRSQQYDVLLAMHHQKKTVKQAQLSTIAKQQEEMEEDNDVALTDAEEVQLVLKGVFQSQPEPLSTRVIIPTRRRSQFLQMRELFFSSVAKIPQSDSGGLMSGAILGRALVYNPETGQKVTRPSKIYAERMKEEKAAAAAGAGAGPGPNQSR